jgi:hypothetical protein
MADRGLKLNGLIATGLSAAPSPDRQVQMVQVRRVAEMAR